MQIIDADNADIQQIVEIEKNFFDKECYTYSQLVDMANNSNYSIKIFKDYDIFCGYIIIYKNIDFDEIFKIGVKDQYKRKGVGTSLLTFAKNSCLNKIYLEVRASNEIAINFYLSNGFNINGRRKNYYSGNEDAILMEYIK